MTDYSPGPTRPAAGLNLQLILLALVFVLVLALAIFMAIRTGSIDQRMGELSNEIKQATSRIEESDQRSDEALRIARKAEESAQVAALQRDEADRRRELAEADASTARQQATDARDEMERLRQEQEQQLVEAQQNLNKVVETRRTALGLVLNLGSDVMKFDFNKADLKWEHRELLSRVVGILLTLEGYGVYVYGHTDDVGSVEYNLELSRKRAQAVRDYLVESGIDPEIVSVEGFGKERPLVKGTSAEARAKNRRVEIGVINTRINYQRSIP